MPASRSFDGQILQKWRIPKTQLSGFPESVEDKFLRFRDPKNLSNPVLGRQDMT